MRGSVPSSSSHASKSSKDESSSSASSSSSPHGALLWLVMSFSMSPKNALSLCDDTKKETTQQWVLRGEEERRPFIGEREREREKDLLLLFFLFVSLSLYTNESFQRECLNIMMMMMCRRKKTTKRTKEKRPQKKEREDYTCVCRRHSPQM